MIEGIHEVIEKIIYESSKKESLSNELQDQANDLFNQAELVKEKEISTSLLAESDMLYSQAEALNEEIGELNSIGDNLSSYLKQRSNLEEDSILEAEAERSVKLNIYKLLEKANELLKEDNQLVPNIEEKEEQSLIEPSVAMELDDQLVPNIDEEVPVHSF